MDHDETQEIEALLDESMTKEGYVYVMYAEGTRFIKIGQAQDVNRRRADLQIGCPQRLSILSAIPASDAPALETLMHAHFSAYHLHGDWFELPEDVPTSLKLLAVFFGHNTDFQPQSRVVPTQYKILTKKILELVEQYKSLSIPSFLDLLGDHIISPGALKVQLHRLYVAGLIGKTGRGVYVPVSETEGN